jgi:putative ABC transport system ATP-binding protein/lipoprotein-releasing system ATP-binding protein
VGIVVHNVDKSFGNPPTYALKDISFEIQDGEFVSISGRSGSGKTTLLYVISTLDQPTAGQVTIDGNDPFAMSEDEIHQFRNTEVGFIFQFHYLLPELTAIENVLLPARKVGRYEELMPRAQSLLEQFGLKGKEGRLPSQLSGGEQQRVAIARSLVMSPKYIFADEPTGNLDTANGMVVMDLLKKVNRENKTTLVLVTHEPDYAAMASRQIHLVDGRLEK